MFFNITGKITHDGTQNVKLNKYSAMSVRSCLYCRRNEKAFLGWGGVETDRRDEAGYICALLWKSSSVRLQQVLRANISNYAKPSHYTPASFSTTTEECVSVQSSLCTYCEPLFLMC